MCATRDMASMLSAFHSMTAARHEAEYEANSALNQLDPTRSQAEHMEQLIALTTNIQQNKNDPYGDGDQSRVKAHTGLPGQHLIDVWSEGGDFDVLTPSNARKFSDFIKACFFGKEKDVARMIKQAREQDIEAKQDAIQPGTSTTTTTILKPSSALFQLLERRESLLRMNGLLACITGSRMIGKVPPSLFKNSNYVGVVRALIEAGTRVNIHDMAGYTPLHHCCTAYASSVSLEIAHLLVAAGANVNACNRAGRVALMEPIMASRLDIIKLLIEAGADPTIPDTDGAVPLTIARTLPGCLKLVSLHSKRSALMGKRVKLCNMPDQQSGEGRTNIPLNGLVGRCYRWDSKKDKYYVQVEDEPGREYLVTMKQMEIVQPLDAHDDNKPKCSAPKCEQPGIHRCAKCLEAAYCSRDCQRGHWSKHKLTCRPAAAAMLPLGAAGDESQHEMVISSWGDSKEEQVKSFSGDLAVRDEPGRSQAAGQDFIVKIQISLLGPEGAMAVYNRDKSFFKLLPSSDPSHAVLRSIIETQGVNGMKGYFRVVTRDYGIVAIQPKIQPPQPW